MPPVAALDIYRFAWLIIKLHGNQAIVVAATRADELLGRGDLEGQRVWLRIVDAIRELQSREVPSGAKRH